MIEAVDRSFLAPMLRNPTILRERLSMEPSRVCLSPWQIDLAEVLASQKLKTTTEEILSRLASFIHAYLLFDRIFIPEKYRESPILQAIDPEGDIFAADARVADPYRKTDDGYTHVDIDPSLLFRNRRHLQANSNAWLKQHIVLDLSEKQRSDLIDYLNRDNRSTRWFYQLMLAEHQVLFQLATFNAAFLVVYASLAQVYLPDITELRRFANFLYKASKNRAAARPGDVLGAYNFELPTGSVEARIKIPPLLAAVTQRMVETNFTAALRHLRQHFRPLREAFRTIASGFMSHEGNELVSSDMAGKEVQAWNEYVSCGFDQAVELLLLKSEVVTVEIHAGEEARIFDTLRERIVARGSLLRAVPPQSCATRSHRLGDLATLGIENVIPFEPKLFRIGGRNVNKRQALHKGLGLIVGLPLSIEVQVIPEGLSHPRIRAYGKEKLPHLYMICTRPRVTVNPQVHIRHDRIDLEFRFWQETHTESRVMSLPWTDVRNVTVDTKTCTDIVFQGINGEQRMCHASLLYQSLVKSMVPEDDVASVLDPESAGLSGHQITDLVRTDLEVIYVGQSKGRDLTGTAIARLAGHEKWETFYRDIVEHNMHREMWILLIAQSASQHLNLTVPGVEGRDSDAAELVRRANRPIRLNPSDLVNFTEAALISYFKPSYNDKFKKGAFPSRKHQSYERFFLQPVDVASIELETLRSMGFRLYSKTVAPRAVHLKMWRLNSSFDVWQMFAGLDTAR